MRARKRALVAGGFGGVALFGNLPLILDGGIDWADVAGVVLSLVAVGLLAVPALIGVRDRMRMWLAIAGTMVMILLSLVGGFVMVMAPLTLLHIPAYWGWTAIGTFVGGIAAAFGFSTVIGLRPPPSSVRFGVPSSL